MSGIKMLNRFFVAKEVLPVTRKEGYYLYFYHIVITNNFGLMKIGEQYKFAALNWETGILNIHTDYPQGKFIFQVTMEIEDAN